MILVSYKANQPFNDAGT